MAEGGQRIQTSSCKVNKFWDVIYNMMILVSNAVLYI